MTETTEYVPETCVRCGEAGEDRRTLWMACFYAMEELKPIPFEKQMRFSTDLEQLEKADEPKGVRTGKGDFIVLVPGTVTTKASLTPHELYTLRVCKDCRASWMDAIKTWFDEGSGAVKKELLSPGTGIFVRRNGTNVEISEDEWQRDNPGREPVRFKAE